MTYALPSKFNYKTVLGVSSEHSRVSSTIVPTSGSSYSSTNKSKIEFLIPPISYLSSQDSYLTFKVKLAGNSTGPVAKSAAFDGGPMSIIRAVTVYNSENQVISEIQHWPQATLKKLHSKGSEYLATVGQNAFGYSTEWNSVPSVATDNAPRVKLADLNALMRGEKNTEVNYFPILLQSPAGTGPYVKLLNDGTANNGNGNSSDEVVVAIPLEYLSGIFNESLPLKYMSSRSHALRIDVQLADIDQCVTVWSTTGLATLPAGAESNFVYTLSDVAIVAEYVSLGAADDARIQAAIFGEGLTLQYEDISTHVNTDWTGGSSYSTLIPKYSISLNSVTCQLRNGNTMNDLRNNRITGSRKWNLKTFQTKLGPSMFPNSPINFESNFSGAAYLEWSKSGGSITNKMHQPSSRFFNAPNCGGFEVAVDFSSKDEVDGLLSGKDTRSGSSQCQILMTRDTTVAVPLHVTTIFNCTNVLVIKQGVAQPLERM